MFEASWRFSYVELVIPNKKNSLSFSCLPQSYKNESQNFS